MTVCIFHHRLPETVWTDELFSWPLIDLSESHKTQEPYLKLIQFPFDPKCCASAHMQLKVSYVCAYSCVLRTWLLVLKPITSRALI